MLPWATDAIRDGRNGRIPLTRGITFLCLAFLLHAGTAPDVAAQDLLIRNARIVDANGVIERGNIVIRNGRIASIGAGATASGLTEIDAEGMSAMPAFIDGHRHIMGRNFDQERVVRMQQFLDAGYTTLMEGGGRPPDIVDLKRQIADGELVGPRIITSGRADPGNFPTPEMARAQVRALADAGVDIIKARIEAEDKAVLEAIVDEGHRVGLEVMVHAANVPAMVAAVEAGAAKLVHTPHNSFMTPEHAQMVADAGIENLSTVGFAVPLFDVYNNDNDLIPEWLKDGTRWYKKSALQIDMGGGNNLPLPEGTFYFESIKLSGGSTLSVSRSPR